MVILLFEKQKKILEISIRRAQNLSPRDLFRNVCDSKGIPN